MPLATGTEVLAPIPLDWTIVELVDWLSDDSRQHDPALRHPLAVIEAAVTCAAWVGTPSTVALIRSLAASARTHGSVRLGALVRIAQMAPAQPGTGSFARFETVVEGEEAETDRMPQPQVA